MLPDTWGIRYLLLMCNRLPPNLAAQSTSMIISCFCGSEIWWFWIRVPHEVVNQAADWGYRHPGSDDLLLSSLVWLYFLAGYCLDTSFFLPRGPFHRLPQCPHSLVPSFPWGNYLKERKGPTWKLQSSIT